MSWTLQAAVICGPGRIHKENEDAFYFDGYSLSLNEMNKETAVTIRKPGPGSLWAICDGMGGQSGGEVAAHLAVRGLKGLQDALATREFEPTVRSWTRQASQAVLDRTSGGGSTLALVYFRDSEALVAHVGDSRVYRARGSSAVRLTRDHTRLEMLLAAGMITAEQAATHPQRHVITRYLGMDPEVTCDPTFAEPFPVQAGDRLILCSDGLTDLVDDAAIGEISGRCAEATDCARQLYAAAMNNGGHDNLTILVLNLCV